MLYVCISVWVRHACISTQEWFCMYVWNDTFPSLIFRTHLREWVYPLSWLDPVWLTHINSPIPSSSYSPPPHPHPLHNTIFWFIGLISLCWWSTEDVRQNLQRVFMVHSTDTLAWLNIHCHIHMRVQKCAHANIEIIQKTKTCTHATHLHFVSHDFHTTGVYVLVFLWTEINFVHDLMTSNDLLQLTVISYDPSGNIFGKNKHGNAQ